MFCDAFLLSFELPVPVAFAFPLDAHFTSLVRPRNSSFHAVPWLEVGLGAGSVVDVVTAGAAPDATFLGRLNCDDGASASSSVLVFTLVGVLVSGLTCEDVVGCRDDDRNMDWGRLGLGLDDDLVISAAADEDAADVMADELE